MKHARPETFYPRTGKGNTRPKSPPYNFFFSTSVKLGVIAADIISR